MLNFGSLQAKKRARSSRADFRIVTNVSGETTDIHILLYTCSTNLIDMLCVCVSLCLYIPMYEYYRNYFNRKNKFNIKKKLAVSWFSYILKYSILLLCEWIWLFIYCMLVHMWVGVAHALAWELGKGIWCIYDKCLW